MVSMIETNFLGMYCYFNPILTSGFLTQLVFCQKKTMWFIGVEVEQETSAPPPKKIPGSAPVYVHLNEKFRLSLLPYIIVQC